MPFKVLAQDKDTLARAGVLNTPRGEVLTPVFMPVATQASVKALDSDDMRRLGANAILANSYHLYLRPGVDLMQAAGGLHKFMDYDGFILTDSGGFQVLSLSKLRQVDDEGVTFKSHIDGSKHRLTPESVINVQRGLGSDAWTTLDELCPFPAEEPALAAALERTLRWTDRSVPEVERARAEGVKFLFFPLYQGALYPALRKRSAEHMAGVPGDGVSIGGLCVGEPKDMTWSSLRETSLLLPQARARYLMGVGTPRDLWDAVASGADMMDCVYPTRVARNGQVMARTGKYNITNAKCRRDFTPLDPECSCFVCARYTKAYLGHLFRADEIAIHRLLSYHNLHYMADIMTTIRKALLEGRFAEERGRFLERYKDLV
ncbi:MAG: tRNA guanosine(34) transglycosylase Tgt [Elusimicrobiota bacterium]|nr:tRNA guanosine(34) transglycosylase Tgt [Elusimicrobiota bacterium]